MIVAISPYFSYLFWNLRAGFWSERIIPLLFLTYNAAIKERVQEWSVGSSIFILFPVLAFKFVISLIHTLSLSESFKATCLFFFFLAMVGSRLLLLKGSLIETKNILKIN